jgi:hypothetical protein
MRVSWLECRWGGWLGLPIVIGSPGFPIIQLYIYIHTHEERPSQLAELTGSKLDQFVLRLTHVCVYTGIKN